ncbi:proline--tRNA ligase [Patescibacteria group bacterium]|nr:proline--tRNA ligase [Patescibacteria group bacterium]
MKFTQNPFRTTKTVSSDLVSKNAKLLTQASFIHQEVAGIYTFLPLGLRVLNKIEKIIREEMDKVAIEIQMTSLAPKKIWEETGRINTVDVLMKTSGANEASLAKSNTEYVLNSTHEEMVTPLVQEFAHSYKDFPVAVYQIQTKFRNEPRAKTGLLRCREFRMKDAYSFHRSVEDLKRYYEVMKEVYMTVFRRVGLGDDTVIALASGGDFTTDYSHEFQTIVDAGEDTLFIVKSKNLCFNREVAPSQAPKLNDDQEEPKPMTDVEGIGMIGVDELAKFLQIPVEKTTKTLLFETDKGEVIAAAVRGGYDVDEEKLKKVVDAKSLKLASADVVKKVTGAEVGYAGPLNLPDSVKVYFDESTSNRRNFECGANKTHYHTINVNWERDLPLPEQFYDFKVAKEGDIYPETGEVYEVKRGCEVGNIFPLHTKFSKAFNFTYLDEQGKPQTLYMGCYGIGSSRLVGVIVEKYADDKGLVWPKQLAPFTVHLIDIQQHDRGQEIYDHLQAAGIEVIWDDRDARAGEKFADADLIGVPYRAVVSTKTGDKIELKERTSNETQLVTLEELLERAR